MSGDSGTAIAQHGILECHASLLEEPFTPAELTGRVREVIDRAA